VYVCVCVRVYVHACVCTCVCIWVCVMTCFSTYCRVEISAPLAGAVIKDAFSILSEIKGDSFQVAFLAVYLFLHLYICLVSMYFPMGSKMYPPSSLRSGAIILRAHLHIHLNRFLCIYICLLSMYFPVQICVCIHVKNKSVISVSSISMCVSIYSLLSPTYSFPCPRLPPPLPNYFLHLLQLVCQRVPSSQILHILK